MNGRTIRCNQGFYQVTPIARVRSSQVILVNLKRWGTFFCGWDLFWSLGGFINCFVRRLHVADTCQRLPLQKPRTQCDSTTANIPRTKARSLESLNSVGRLQRNLSDFAALLSTQGIFHRSKNFHRAQPLDCPAKPCQRFEGLRRTGNWSKSPNGRMETNGKEAQAAEATSETSFCLQRQKGRVHARRRQNLRLPPHLNGSIVDDHDR